MDIFAAKSMFELEDIARSLAITKAHTLSKEDLIKQIQESMKVFEQIPEDRRVYVDDLMGLSKKELQNLAKISRQMKKPELVARVASRLDIKELETLLYESETDSNDANNDAEMTQKEQQTRLIDAAKVATQTATQQPKAVETAPKAVETQQIDEFIPQPIIRLPAAFGDDSNAAKPTVLCDCDAKMTAYEQKQQQKIDMLINQIIVQPIEKLHCNEMNSLTFLCLLSEIVSLRTCIDALSAAGNERNNARLCAVKQQLSNYVDKCAPDVAYLLQFEPQNCNNASNSHHHCVVTLDHFDCLMQKNKRWQNVKDEHRQACGFSKNDESIVPVSASELLQLNNTISFSSLPADIADLLMNPPNDLPAARTHAAINELCSLIRSA